MVAPNLSPSGEHRYPGPEIMYEYDLFAVINHEGQLNNGHYTNFARLQDEVRFLKHVLTAGHGSPSYSCLFSGTDLMTISASLVYTKAISSVLTLRIPG